jgi:hypothetical protein
LNELINQVNMYLQGKFSQNNSERKTTITLSSQKELDDAFWNESTKVCDFIQMSPHVAEVVIQSRSGFNRPNLRGNSVISAYVTALARVEMDKNIRLLLESGAILYYSDTDSLLYSLKKHQINPLIEGPCYHQFKNELPGCVILSFYSLGPKMYQLTFMNLKTKKIETLSKLKGFYLHSLKAKEIVHDKIFKEFILAYLREENVEAKLGQWLIKTTKTRELRNIIIQKVLRNSMFNKRVAFCGQINSLTTLPYGYDEAMYNKEILNQ